MLFGMYTATDNAEYIAAGSNIEEIVEQLELWSDDKPLNMGYLEVFDSIPVKVVHHTTYKVVPIY